MAMMRRYYRYNRLINININKCNRLLFATSNKKLKIKKEEERDNDININRKRSGNVQEEYASMWETTTDDKIERLTQELRKACGGKKMALFGAASGYLCAKMGWYQFEFLGMPQEIEVVMVYLPFMFLSLHWGSWYMNMNAIYNKLNFKLPPGWKKNDGLIGGSKPQYHQLLVMDDKTNLVLLDKWCSQYRKHQIMCTTMFCMNMSLIMLTLSINPFADPALSALQPFQVVAYSCYPLVSYAFSLIVYNSPMKNIPIWKQEIIEELNLKENNHKETREKTDE